MGDAGCKTDKRAGERQYEGSGLRSFKHGWLAPAPASPIGSDYTSHQPPATSHLRRGADPCVDLGRHTQQHAAGKRLVGWQAERHALREIVVHRGHCSPCKTWRSWFDSHHFQKFAGAQHPYRNASRCGCGWWNRTAVYQLHRRPGTPSPLATTAINSDSILRHSRLPFAGPAKTCWIALRRWLFIGK